MPRRARAALVILLVVQSTAARADDAALPPLKGAATETAAPAGLPTIGKWMIAPDGAPSDWLGERLDGRTLREPINLVIVDRRAKSVADAVAALLPAMAAAGFPSRFGHSAGYSALIGGTRFSELPRGREHAFSDRLFLLTNDHGRLFGPSGTFDGFVFTGAFSRESVDPLRDPGHRFDSFAKARDRLAAGLAASGAYARGAPVALGNALADDPAVTTGDHDGLAAVLVRE